MRAYKLSMAGLAAMVNDRPAGLLFGDEHFRNVTMQTARRAVEKCPAGSVQVEKSKRCLLSSVCRCAGRDERLETADNAPDASLSKESRGCGWRVCNNLSRNSFYDFMTSKSFNTSTITSEESFRWDFSCPLPERATSEQPAAGKPPPRIPAPSRRFYAADDGFQEAIKISLFTTRFPARRIRS